MSPAQPSTARSGEPIAPLTRIAAHDAGELAPGMQPTLNTLAETAVLSNFGR